MRYLEDFKKAGADIITVHAEACTHLHRTVARIKELGMKAGVSLNPATPLSELEYILEDLDMVLVMTVNPGFGGQVMIPGMLKKIKELRNMTRVLEHEFDIEVDGGITLENVQDVIEAGANVIVSGTSVFRGDIMSNVESFKKRFSKNDQIIRFK
jgi:ribulose-phosphate 3-epimerase